MFDEWLDQARNASHLIDWIHDFLQRVIIDRIQINNRWYLWSPQKGQFLHVYLEVWVKYEEYRVESMRSEHLSLWGNELKVKSVIQRLRIIFETVSAILGLFLLINVTALY